MNFLTTVTGSYPRKDVQKDTLRKSSVSDQEALDMIEWAVKEQADLGLDIITDGEGYRENMYWFYQLRLDGVDAENKKYKHFSTGGSMDKVDLTKTHVSVILSSSLLLSATFFLHLSRTSASRGATIAACFDVFISFWCASGDLLNALVCICRLLGQRTMNILPRKGRNSLRCCL